jgi:uncharacterized membrane protein YgcG
MSYSIVQFIRHHSSPRLALLLCGSLVLTAVQVGCAIEQPQPDTWATTQPTAAAYAAPQPAQAAQPSSEELNQLVAPIALYPDALVAQVLAASTYPTEVVQTERWMQQNTNLNGDALAKAVDQQPWDPSVKALTQFPSVLAMMDKNLSWTSSLGENYGNDEAAVFDAVQEMRQRAQQAGNLKSTPQETVTTEGQTIVIEPANQQVVYVPEYDPWFVYGAPLAFYPDWVGFYGEPGIFFGAGIGIGFFGGFGWGWGHWGADWHHHDVDFDHHHFVSHSPTFGHGGFGHAGGFHPGGFGGGFSHSGGSPAMHSSAFSGFNHGGTARGFASRGGASFAHSGGFHGGGFHGGGGGHR